MARGTIRIKLDGVDQMGPRLLKRSTKFSERQTIAIQTVAKRVREEIENEGRANIAEGGNFSSPRWQQGFRALLSFTSRNNINIRVVHGVKYWRVFEFGAKIHGKPMLWIPLSFSNAGKRGVRARDYGKPLFRVDRAGKAPLLLDDTGPQYFGKTSVTIPRKWHLRPLIKRIARKMGSYYRQAMKNG